MALHSLAYLVFLAEREVWVPAAARGRQGDAVFNS